MKNRCPLYFLILPLIIFGLSGFLNARQSGSGKPPIYIAFLWHMHQPIYYAGENLLDADLEGKFSFSLKKVLDDRTGPYTSWPLSAVKKGAGFSHFGAQVSFTGSLIENLNCLESSGDNNFKLWKSSWQNAAGLKTSLGNPRLDMVSIGYYHPLMGLINNLDIKEQILRHRTALLQNFPDIKPSKGIFPPENAFSERMIPVLKDAGLDWVLVDNAHFERACTGYPYNTGANLYEPNRADCRNPDPADWTSLTGLWIPMKTSALWARQPHFVGYYDPSTGQSSRIIAVPCDRYPSTEDGRGGFGALQYEYVLSQLEAYNKDPKHPMIVVLAHDGDNYGGGTDSYYGSNFDKFVAWLNANPSRFQCTTVQDYLDMFPPEENDIIHVEDGSWSGADNGDPQFKKWLGAPDGSSYSPDRNSWAVVTANENIINEARSLFPDDAEVNEAERDLLTSETSCYWYWDNSEGGLWDSNPTRALNLAFPLVYGKIQGLKDSYGPSIFLPQRDPYNPGQTEWTLPVSADFKVWTYAYDRSGLKDIRLCYWLQEAAGLRMDYAGSWTKKAMTGLLEPSKTIMAPKIKAGYYSCLVRDVRNSYCYYYVEAEDSAGNLSRSPIQSCWVGSSSSQNTNGFLIDGSLDSSACLVGQSAGARLYASLKYPYLYLATNSAKSQRKDVFIFLSDKDTAMEALPWSKKGSVHSWKLYLGNESSNGWAGWFGNSVDEESCAGDFLEGMIDISEEFSPVPDTLYVSVAGCSTEDGGALLNRIPGGSEGSKIGLEESIKIPVVKPSLVQDHSPVPHSMDMSQNYPNPCNPSTRIEFYLNSNQAQRVSLKLYDMLGRAVATLYDGSCSAHYELEVNLSALGLPSGIYLYRLQTPGGSMCKKLIYLK